MKRWQVNSLAPLVLHTWGAVSFVYHRESGQTHFINASCRQILELIAEQSLTTIQVHERLLEHHGIDEDSDLQEAVITVIRLLEGLGVVVACGG